MMGGRGSISGISGGGSTVAASGGGSTSTSGGVTHFPTASEFNSMAAPARVAYLDAMPVGSTVTVESGGMMPGMSQTNTLRKIEPTWNNRTWEVIDGPVNSISHFDTSTVKSDDIAYGTKFKKVKA